MPLHFAGVPCDLDSVYALAEVHGLRVIEDATHAFGARLAPAEGRLDGDHRVLLLRSREGRHRRSTAAPSLTPPAEDVNAARVRLLGIDKDTEARYKNTRAWDYDVVRRLPLPPGARIRPRSGCRSWRGRRVHVNRQAYCRRYTERSPVWRTSERSARTGRPSRRSSTSSACRGTPGRSSIAHLSRLGIATGIHFRAGARLLLSTAVPARTSRCDRTCRAARW